MSKLERDNKASLQETIDRAHENYRKAELEGTFNKLAEIIRQANGVESSFDSLENSLDALKYSLQYAVTEISKARTNIEASKVMDKQESLTLLDKLATQLNSILTIINSNSINLSDIDRINSYLKDDTLPRGITLINQLDHQNESYEAPTIADDSGETSPIIRGLMTLIALINLLLLATTGCGRQENPNLDTGEGPTPTEEPITTVEPTPEATEPNYVYRRFSTGGASYEPIATETPEGQAAQKELEAIQQAFTDEIQKLSDEMGLKKGTVLTGMYDHDSSSSEQSGYIVVVAEGGTTNGDLESGDILAVKKPAEGEDDNYEVIIVKNYFSKEELAERALVGDNSELFNIQQALELAKYYLQKFNLRIEKSEETGQNQVILEEEDGTQREIGAFTFTADNQPAIAIETDQGIEVFPISSLAQVEGEDGEGELAFVDEDEKILYSLEEEGVEKGAVTFEKAVFLAAIPEQAATELDNLEGKFNRGWIENEREFYAVMDEIIHNPDRDEDIQAYRLYQYNEANSAWEVNYQPPAEKFQISFAPTPENISWSIEYNHNLSPEQIEDANRSLTVNIFQFARMSNQEDAFLPKGEFESFSGKIGLDNERPIVNLSEQIQQSIEHIVTQSGGVLSGRAGKFSEDRIFNLNKPVIIETTFDPDFELPDYDEVAVMAKLNTSPDYSRCYLLNMSAKTEFMVQYYATVDDKGQLSISINIHPELINFWRKELGPELGTDAVVSRALFGATAHIGSNSEPLNKGWPVGDPFGLADAAHESWTVRVPDQIQPVTNNNTDLITVK